MTENFSDRVKQKRKEMGLTQKQLGELAGLSHVTISKWESGSEPKAENLHDLARVFECSTDWLLYGSTKEASSSEKKGYIPLVNWSEVDNLTEPKSWYETSAKISKNAFALQVKNDSMESTTGGVSIPRGSIIIVEPYEEAVSGSFVIAHIKGSSEAVIKKLAVDGPNSYLVSLNQTYKPIEVNGDCRILGVVKRAEIDL